MIADMASSKPHAADSHDLIRVQGARVNNLKDVSVEIPKRRLTVFTGVSGSGKSSLVFGTIAAESQRLINETYSAFVQGFMPTMARPDVDVLEGLTTAIIVDQERMGANSRSTVGTVTDANAMLRVLWSRLGKPHIGPATAFSFNVPTRKASGAMTADKGKGERIVVRDVVYHGGMCPRCEGMGQVNDIDLSQLYDDTKSLSEGALTIPGYTAEGWYMRTFAAIGIDPDKPIRKYTKKELHLLLYQEPTKVKVEKLNLTYEGLIPRIKKSFLSKDVDAMQPHIRAFVERAVTFTTCPDCKGTRLNEAARSSKIKQDQHRRRLRDADQRPGRVGARSEGAVRRAAPGEAAADARLVRGDRARLSQPRPAVGHALGRRGAAHEDGRPPRVVAHRRDLRLRRADDRAAPARHPADERAAAAAARQGQHRPRRRAQARDDRDRRSRRRSRPRRRRRPAGKWCSRAPSMRCGRAARSPGGISPIAPSLKPSVRKPSGVMKVRGARTHNLKNVDVDIPLGVLVVVTGVAGSGKSSLIHGSVSGRDGVVTVDQTAIRGSRRSNPATYTGLLDPIRTAFAKANGVKPALFSANSEGACPTCNGAGVIYTDLAMMAGVTTVCEECEGRRFQASVLKYRLGKLNIAEVLDLPVKDAVDFFGAGRAHTPAAHAILQRMADVGLGYLRLGQPLTTLSGGERQRLKLATHMGEEGGVYVLDEPTTGLHLADLEQLLGLLDRLVDSGKSVIVIEHHQSVMAHADWIIDLGPARATTAGGSCSKARRRISWRRSRR